MQFSDGWFEHLILSHHSGLREHGLSWYSDVLEHFDAEMAVLHPGNPQLPQNGREPSRWVSLHWLHLSNLSNTGISYFACFCKVSPTNPIEMETLRWFSPSRRLLSSVSARPGYQKQCNKWASFRRIADRTATTGSRIQLWLRDEAETPLNKIGRLASSIVSTTSKSIIHFSLSLSSFASLHITFVWQKILQMYDNFVKKSCATLKIISRVLQEVI